MACIPRRSRKHDDVIEVLTDPMVTRGCPEYIRSDIGSEFTANVPREWLANNGVITTNIEPSGPWGNVYNESPMVV